MLPARYSSVTLIGGIFFLAVAGCGRQPEPAPLSEMVTPFPTPPGFRRVAEQPVNTPKAAPPATPGATPEPVPTVAVAPPPRAPQPATTPGVTMLSPAELEARYFAAQTSVEQRGDIIHELGAIASPQAADVLVRIFDADKRLETRLEAFGAVCDFPDETCREQKMTLLRKGTSPDKPQMVRLTALQSLADFDDARARAALKVLAADHDPTVRTLAAERLKELAP